ncbi:TonB family protein / TonB-dependent receptor [Enhygromyxa salina]|uniref:TonB family protein / TonB-dependent receptor n=1 Tax=Enhygromyxa salina TaxID=215803 RepID=A0A0C2D1U6_9BACT|nr:TonB-dependent receptor [Enhygromyxa salina]KIG14132.1 TonB family protein / TonB-dependent receptor [Enhygromyxa salina]
MKRRCEAGSAEPRLRKGRAVAGLALVFVCALLVPTLVAAAPPPGPTAPASELVPPTLINEVRPYAYPPELLAREQPPGGEVMVQYVVGIDGVPKEIELLAGVDPVLDAIALEVVAALRFSPATYEDEPVEVVLSLAIPFAPPEPSVPDEPDAPSEPDELEGGTGNGDTEPIEQPKGPPRITGVVREAGSGTPVSGATILAVPAGDYPLGKVRHKLYGEETEPAWIRKALSTDTGEFALAGVPNGQVRVIIIAPNFERLEWVVELAADQRLETKYFLTRTSANPFRTEVSVDRDGMTEAVVRTITIEEVNEIPGTLGDALKSIQNFPGVARAPFGAGQLTIRGAAPGDSGVYLGYHEIPTLFHFGGLTSVFNADILAQIDFIPGNFDSRYGDALGGVVNVQPRKGRRDGFHGYIDTDLFDTGVLAEGPIGKGSYILSGRRSYVDLLLPLVIPDEVGLGLTLAPRYWDYQGLFDYPVGGGELSVRVFGSDDRSKLLFTEQNDVSEDERNQLETVQGFHRVDLVYRKVDGPWEFLITPSYKREYFSGAIFGNFDFEVDTDTLSARAEISRRLSANARLRVGTEVVSEWWRGRAAIVPFGADAVGTTKADATVRETDYLRLIPSLYSTLTLRVGKRLMLYPGLRFDWFAAPQNRAALDPRLRFIIDVADKTKLKGGVGLYSQGPTEVENDLYFGNPRVRLSRSVHTSLSVVRQLPWDVSVELTGFYKRLWDLTSPSGQIVKWPGEDDPRPETFASTGTGDVYGGELLLKKELGDRFYGWVSYTLMRSVRVPAPGEPQALFDFDQTHILTLIASYDFPLNWRIGARMRVVSGNPYTPIVNGVFDATSANYIPIQGPTNSARLPTFHQLDLRVDKTWVYRRVKVTSYLDILNVYSAENTEFLSYGYDFTVTRPVLSLPTAPSIGLKIEW